MGDFGLLDPALLVALLVALLFHGYATGVSSVRELEQGARTGGSERQEGGRATAEGSRKREDRRDPGSPVGQWLEIGIETVPDRNVTR